MPKDKPLERMIYPFVVQGRVNQDTYDALEMMTLVHPGRTRAEITRAALEQYLAAAEAAGVPGMLRYREFCEARKNGARGPMRAWVGKLKDPRQLK